MILPKLDIVIPVYNNSDVLDKSIHTQIMFYSKYLRNFDWNILIANNKSTDDTLDIAKRLSKKCKRVHYLDIPKKGRGNALKTAWLLSKADFLSYMDVDLATDLNAFPILISNLVNGYDLSVGSKYIRGARCRRYLFRYILSRVFNMINFILFNARFSDAQCGFKAVNRRVAQTILPSIRDGNWFFDTELLVYAQKKGFSIKEVPVKWIELGMAKKSGVKMMRTIWEFMIKTIELWFRRELHG